MLWYSIGIVLAKLGYGARTVLVLYCDDVLSPAKHAQLHHTSVALVLQWCIHIHFPITVLVVHWYGA